VSEFKTGDTVRIKTTGKVIGTAAYGVDDWVKVSTPAGVAVLHSSFLRKVGRPKEPTGYGALVVDKNEDAWTLVGDGEWYGENGHVVAWASIKKPTVLGEGVPE